MPAQDNHQRTAYYAPHGTIVTLWKPVQ